jgi:hypothetical protein
MSSSKKWNDARVLGSGGIVSHGARQRVVAYLGRLDEQGRLGIKRAARRQSSHDRQASLFPEPEPFWVEVDAARVAVENSRQFGGPWLGLELARLLKLPDFFRKVIPVGREDIPWSGMALVLVLSRLCKPSSDPVRTGADDPGRVHVHAVARPSDDAGACRPGRPERGLPGFQRGLTD